MGLFALNRLNSPIKHTQAAVAGVYRCRLSFEFGVTEEGFKGGWSAVAGCFCKVEQEKRVCFLAHDQLAASLPRFFFGRALPPFIRRPPNTVPKMEDLPCSYVPGARLVLDQKESSNLHHKRKGFWRAMENYSQFYVLS